MYCKPAIKLVVFIVILCCSVFNGCALCQDDLEKALAKKIDSMSMPLKTGNVAALSPDDALQSITIPSGFGGYGTYIYGGVGGVYPQVYHTNADLITSGGICAGNPVKAVNVAAGLNLTDVHRFRDFSGNLIVSRTIFAGSSISVGGLQLFANKHQSDAPGATFYFAFSHAVQTLSSETEGASKLSYTIGIGNGRFYVKSFDDIKAGKGMHGTAVFGSVSYEIVQHVNVNAEWSGINLGVTFGLRPFKNPLSIGIGAVNLTRYAADKPDIIFTFGYPLSLSRSQH